MIEFTGNELEELQYCIIYTHNENHPLNLKIKEYTLMIMNQQSNEEVKAID